MYGGSTTAIVVNIPGEAASVPTALDGYELAKQGRAGPALGIAAISSFVAGTISLIGVTFFAPALAGVALAFGPPEYFALMFMALSLVVSLSEKALLKGLAGMLAGLMFSLVGMDPISGTTRLTFGFSELIAGVNFIAVVIGLFAFGEIFVNLETEITHIYNTKIKNWLPTWQDIRDTWVTMIRSTCVGFFLGLLPGCGPAVSTFVAYDVEKRFSKHPEKFGHGAMEGVAGPEGANNAGSSAQFIPLLALGIPPGPTLAMLLGALMMYGIQPGPRLWTEQPQLVWSVIASMYIGNVMLLILNLPLVGFWARIAFIPFPILGPLIVVFSLIGAYSVRFLMFDVWMSLLFGVIGYLMRKFGYPLAPVVLATILAQPLEIALKQALAISAGSYTIFFNRPIALGFMLLAFGVILRGVWVQYRSRRLEFAEEEAD
jgi:putative tricarboxylic transport membrane protein